LPSRKIERNEPCGYYCDHSPLTLFSGAQNVVVAASAMFHRQCYQVLEMLKVSAMEFLNRIVSYVGGFQVLFADKSLVQMYQVDLHMHCMILKST